jgi:hypothetical protein
MTVENISLHHCHLLYIIVWNIIWLIKQI